MDSSTVIELGSRAIEVLLLICAPIFLAALITGLIISILQAATQINESTLSFVPKLVAILITLIIFGPWMLTLLTDYVRELYSRIPTLIG